MLITHRNIIWAGLGACIPEAKEIIDSKFVFQFLIGMTADAGVFSDVKTAA